MRILGIDSSTPKGSVALLENSRLLKEASLPDGSTYSNCLLSTIDQLLLETGMQFGSIDAFAVTTGPGSFTGLRVGVSLAKGFVLSSQKPFIGVSSLEAMAHRVESAKYPVCTLLDARKKQVYTAKFHLFEGEVKRLTEDSVVSPEELCDSVSEPTQFLGITPYADYFAERLGSNYIPTTQNKFETSAAGAALIAHHRAASEMKGDLDNFSIQYIRKPEAEQNSQKNNKSTEVKHYGN
jgi:tRNA threonylcarbamoyladenosine biosynthesis protein TsaB